MKLGFDLDGVLANWNDPMLALLNKVYNTNHKWDPQVGGPRVWNWAQEEFGFTPAQIHKVWVDHINETDFWETLPVLDEQGMLQVVDLELKHEVYFLTNRTGTGVKRRTETWLMRKGVARPTVLQVHGPKGPVVDALRLGCYIDDNPANLAKGTNPHYDPYLKSAPYNHDTIGMRRVNDITGMLLREGLI